MRMKKFIWLLVAVLVLSGIPVAAQPYNPQNYQGYQFSSEGEPVESPTAMLPLKQISQAQLGSQEAVSLIDVCADDTTIYLLDNLNARIYLLDSQYQLVGTISELIGSKVNNKLSAPEGLYVTENGEIYIADTENQRIVVCDRTGNVLREYGDPGIKVKQEKVKFLPSKIAVNKAGMMNVVVRNVNRGLIQLKADGAFNGFVGAPKVQVNWTDYFWMMFATEAQLERMGEFAPTEYNNVVVDDEGFIYGTIGTLNAATMATVVASKDFSGTYTPIRKLNAFGDDILKRTGFYPPIGELAFTVEDGGASSIADVALSKDGIYTLADSANGKLFTYDQDGNLLYIVGGKGNQYGSYQLISSVTYFGEHLLVTDKLGGTMTVLKLTDYGNCINMAVAGTYNGDYEAADKYWNKALEYDANLYTAYLGKGKAEFRQGNYVAAMEYYRIIRETENYSKAKSALRSQLLEENATVIGLVIVGLVILLFVLWIIRRNRRKKGLGIKTPEQIRAARETLWGKLKYSLYICTHPLDGFYDLKHENRGSMKGAVILYVLTAVTALLKKQCSEYLFNPAAEAGYNLFTVVLLAVGPYLLWCVANWCFTSLMDGEGGMGDMIKATGYAMAPLIISNVLYIILSWGLVGDEGAYMSLISNVGLYWTILLVFLGMMVTQQYGLGKSLATTILTLVGMALILFILLLLFYLTQQVYSFVNDMLVEWEFLRNT